MVALGLLALIQMGLLPGLIVTRLARVRGLWANALIAFPLSLLIDDLAVFALTTLGWYRRPVVLGLFALEILALAALLRRAELPRLAEIAGAARRFFREYPARAGAGGRARALAVFQIVALLLAFFSVLHAAWIYGRPYAAVFTQWDAVVFWDRWAVDWFMSRLPRTSSHYPQLLPAAWSLSYQFLGTSEVKFFARWFMGFFEILVPLSLFYAGWKTRDAGHFLGAAIAGRLLWMLGSRASGYADSPVAYFSLVAMLCLVLARGAPDSGGRTRLLVLGGILAAAAAVTKQGGLWIVLTYGVAALLAFPSDTERGISRARLAAILLVIDAVVIAPWYAYKEIAIRSAADISELGTVLQTVHEGRGPMERMAFAAGILNDRLRIGAVPGAVAAALLGLFALAAGRDRASRGVVLLVCFPYVLLWMRWWSYDHRNLMPVVPILGWMAGIGIHRVVRAMAGARTEREGAGTRPEPGPVPAPMRDGPRDVVSRSARPATRAIVWLIPLAGLALLLLLPLRFRDADMIRLAREKQKQIGEPRLNERLYDYHHRIGFQGKILTDYQILLALPEIGSHFMLGYTNQMEFLDLARRPEVGYALYSARWSRPEVAGWFSKRLREGRIARIFECDGWTLVTTCRGPCEASRAAADAARRIARRGAQSARVAFPSRLLLAAARR